MNFGGFIVCIVFDDLVLGGLLLPFVFNRLYYQMQQMQQIYEQEMQMQVEQEARDREAVAREL